jgi:hypothetical protein
MRTGTPTAVQTRRDILGRKRAGCDFGIGSYLDVAERLDGCPSGNSMSGFADSGETSELPSGGPSRLWLRIKIAVGGKIRMGVRKFFIVFDSLRKTFFKLPIARQ